MQSVAELGAIQGNGRRPGSLQTAGAKREDGRREWRGRRGKGVEIGGQKGIEKEEKRGRKGREKEEETGKKEENEGRKGRKGGEKGEKGGKWRKGEKSVGVLVSTRTLFSATTS